MDKMFTRENGYKETYITIKLSAELNKILTEHSVLNRRSKKQEALLRLEKSILRVL